MKRLWMVVVVLLAAASVGAMVIVEKRSLAAEQHADQVNYAQTLLIERQAATMRIRDAAASHRGDRETRMLTAGADLRHIEKAIERLPGDVRDEALRANRAILIAD